MTSTILYRVAISIGLLASTASASFSATSSSNVAIYWGQGSSQIPLSEVCSDENIDIVNIAFVNQFPKYVGDYPASNFANACEDAYFDKPDGTKSGLLSNCPSIEPGIKACQDNGKKVLLSIGGGWPTDYYLPSEEVARYFAEFLWGAFGPATAEWKALGKPRPFGDASVDGFDLDIESLMATPPFPEYQYKNYDILVSHLKETLFPTGPSTYFISGAPQCVLPDARLAEAISKSSFDFVFVQFYNTPQCSTRAGYNGLGSTSTAFTFDAWVDWLKRHSKNQDVKLYLGMPAGTEGVPFDNPSYLTPTEANDLVSTYQKKHSGIFGGVMLWEATVNSRNKICERPYAAWIKDIISGKFKSEACTSSSSSSSVASSTISIASSTSNSLIATPTMKSPDGSCGPKVGYTCIGYHMGACCSQYGYCGGSADYCGDGCNPIFGNCDVSSSSSVSSTVALTTSSSTTSAASSSSHPVSSSVLSSSTLSNTSALSSAATSRTGSSYMHNSTTSARRTLSSSLFSTPEPSAISSSTSMGRTTSASSNSLLSSSVPYPRGNSTFMPHPTSIGSSTTVHFTDISSPAISRPTQANSSSTAYPVDISSSSGMEHSASSSWTMAYPTPRSSNMPYPAHNSSSSYGNPTSGFDRTSTPCSTSTAEEGQSTSKTFDGYSQSYPSQGYTEGPVSSATKDDAEYTASKPHFTPGHGYPASMPAGSYFQHPTLSSSKEHEGYPEYSAPSSSKSYGGYPEHPISSVSTDDARYPTGPSAVSKSASPSSHPSDVTTTVMTTTYVDVCPTGLTTKTTTITKTGCGSCAHASREPGHEEIPEGWTTRVTVCSHCGPKTTTITLTKPVEEATSVPEESQSTAVAQSRGMARVPGNMEKASGPPHSTGAGYVPVFEGAGGRVRVGVGAVVGGVAGALFSM